MHEGDSYHQARNAVGEVAVVVPTLNAARTLKACLDSLRSQSLRPRIILVDNHSTDVTATIGGELADEVLVVGPERSAQRNAGAALSSERVIGFIDADMVLDTDVVAQAVAAIDCGAASVVVPEVSFGEGYWARVVAYERSFVRGLEGVEAPRFFRREVLATVGGWDEQLDAAEDWDLAIRTRAAGPVRCTTALIHHDEGAVGYKARCRKKAGYAQGLQRFRAKHGPGSLRATIDRPYLRRPWVLLPHPVLGGGLVLLKAGEAAAVFSTLVRNRRGGRRHVRLQRITLRRPNATGE